MHGELLKHYNLLEFLLVLSYLFIITWHRIELEDAPRRMARAVFVGAAWADVGRMRVTHAGDVGRCEPRTPARNQAGASAHVHYWTGARFRATWAALDRGFARCASARIGLPQALAGAIGRLMI